MAELIYSAITSADGYVEDAPGSHRPALMAASGCAPPIGAWRLGVWYSGLAVLLVVDSTGSDGGLQVCRSRFRENG